MSCVIKKNIKCLVQEITLSRNLSPCVCFTDIQHHLVLPILRKLSNGILVIQLIYITMSHVLLLMFQTLFKSSARSTPNLPRHSVHRGIYFL